ncbi:probable Importin subunit beta-1 [Saccharomycodes ludwigii]|uniref:Importin-95 n=1 Tax=Saccharomycodes ludwigii TaxID=36035 RepID=A0A376BA12_9ASCO|nr:hypothetical protein SCDLUD_000653 [Saccharomycodes ludwigii]KAH3903043.1 hypothetical protein SCDLUD_000653 [Saccharomycodes ludwigii]SSD61441.1 probable Importin subunit beta-1 [Saccharomycodes ludwigii]
MSTLEVAQLLENTILNVDPTVRLQSETTLRRLCNENFLQFAGILSQIINDETVKEEARILSALTLKNELTSKDSIKKQQFATRWITQVDDPSKVHIRMFALKGLVCNSYRVANASAQLVAAIADIDLSRGEWPDLMKIMVDNTQSSQPENIKRASLLALGYICESFDAGNEVLISQSNNILIAIVQGAQSSETSKVVRLTALNALADSLSFIKNNMDRDGERNYLMQVVCEATQAEDSEIQVAAFGCLSKIMSLYYVYMKLYMEQALYGLTLTTMQSADEKVASMAVEFWSTICEEEIDIAYEIAQYPESPLQNYNFALNSIKDVLPTILNLLTKQNEDPEDDDWNVSMSAGACLQLYAQNCGNYIVEPVLHFVEQNIASDNWRQREAAVMAFGSILDGPDKTQLANLIHQALPPILNLIKDESLQVKETVAWCLGRIADLVIFSIDTQEHLPNVIQACLIGLQDHPKVITNSAWTIINLVEQLTAANDNSSVLAIYNFYPVLIDSLLKVCNRPDNDFNCRASAYSALSTLVQCSSEQVLESITSVSSFVLDKLGQTMTFDVGNLTTVDKQNLEELQSNVLTVLSSCILKNPSQVSGVSDLLMELFLKLLSKGDTTYVEDDVFFCISALAIALGPDFEKYLEKFSPFLLSALNQVSSQISITAVGLIADISNSLGDSFKKFAPDFMNVLGQMISAPDSKKELKPAVLAVFGDIATNIGTDFVPYLDQVMALCVAAQNSTPENSSLEALDYNLRVHEAVLDAYVGCVAGLADAPKALFPYVGTIFQFLQYLAEEPALNVVDSTARAAVGLIGDIAAMFPGGEIKQFYGQPWVDEFIKNTRSNKNFKQSTRDTAKWSREQQKLQLSL